MIETEEIELNGTLPDDGIGMVIMQPFVELCDHEPYRWENAQKKNKQIRRIINALEVARQADHGCGKTHFTVFPEYSIPGLEGVRKIQDILESGSWENETIIIGGVDGRNSEEVDCPRYIQVVTQKWQPCSRSFARFSRLVHVFADCVIAWWVVVEKQKRITNPFSAP